MAIGAASGALIGLFSTYGVDKNFLKSVNEQVTEGTSALFLMTSEAVFDKVTDAVKTNELKFEIISTTLTDDQEALLKADFGMQQDHEANSC